MPSNKTHHKANGLYFDLRPIFLSLNAHYFNDAIEAKITWGFKRTSAQKKSLRLGSYHPEQRLITIHPCLDQAIVPFICVERIMFHEMLHQHYPSKKVAGRNLVHYRQFYDFEKKYPYLKEADSWLKTNLWRLLQY